MAAQGWKNSWKSSKSKNKDRQYRRNGWTCQTCATDNPNDEQLCKICTNPKPLQTTREDHTEKQKEFERNIRMTKEQLQQFVESLKSCSEAQLEARLTMEKADLNRLANSTDFFAKIQKREKVDKIEALEKLLFPYKSPEQRMQAAQQRIKNAKEKLDKAQEKMEKLAQEYQEQEEIRAKSEKLIQEMQLEEAKAKAQMAGSQASQTVNMADPDLDEEDKRHLQEALKK